ncbi:MAG TPA: hypothetical protein VK348_05260, partial [Planctomycetota bacterium]|nr:hypothetical protein [Planctomycetota bacterium]
LFVGTDLGLFLSNDGGQAWLPVTGGPENVCAEMLFWHNERQLVVVTHGRGAWIATLPVASATPVGAGCAVGTPPLLAAAPPVVGAVETFSLTGASANALVWVGLSFGFPVPQNFGSCVVQVDLANSTPFATSATSASGTWSFNLTIPPIADLVSAPVVAQTLILDAGGPLLGAGDLSNGLQLTLGF